VTVTAHGVCGRRSGKRAGEGQRWGERGTRERAEEK